MASRPLVTVQSPFLQKKSTVTLPHVLTAPIRIDLVQDVHTRMNKNHRQPYAVSKSAGEQTSAQSWGTGRAVSRIPRVSGGGTHRSGQAAFGNMCRGGRMFAPTKVWRKWHVRISLAQRRYAAASALSASAVAPLLMARGHRVERIAEVPLVIADAEFEGLVKTKAALKLLKAIGAIDDVKRVVDSRHVRAGKGKARGRRYAQKRGPLVIHAEKPVGDKRAPNLVLAFRNIRGIDLCDVNRLNLLQLAPGGHVGRFIIWTESAFKQLDKLFGTRKADSTLKKGFRLPQPLLTNSDINRIINSDEVQSALRPIKKATKYTTRKKNPLKNLGAMVKLNPYALAQRRRRVALTVKGGIKKPSTSKKPKKQNRTQFLKTLRTPSIAPVRSELEKGAQL
jgi:large subunit ribosomal protein L4e